MVPSERNPGLLQGSDGCVHVLVWTGAITKQNLGRSLAFATRLAAEHPSGIVAVNVVAHGLQIPDGEAQRYANDVSRTLDPHIRATAVVLPGEGFWVGAARAFLTGLNMVSPLKGKRTIASTIESGFRYAAVHSGRSQTWATETAREVESWASTASTSLR